MTTLLLLILFTWFSTGKVYASQEVISNFDSWIEINKDSSLTVAETIRVYAAGDQIKRGIYRDFPTTYKDVSGLTYRTTFEVLEVLRDGVKDDYHTEKQSNGIRLYVGNSNVLLDSGYYTYTIKYRTEGQLGFYEDHDELYFNITGNGWDFVIQNASADIRLPDGVIADDVKLEAYTGFQGDAGTAYTAWISSAVDGASARFRTTGALTSGEGLTVVVGWPKGFVNEPTVVHKLLTYMLSNLVAVSGIVLTVAVFIYYLLAWWKHGRDPNGTGTVVTHYDIQSDVSPAGARYINRMGLDNKAVTASLINMAVKGYLKIVEQKNKFTVELNKTQGVTLFEEEQVLVDNLFKNSQTSFTFSNSKAATINSMLVKFNKAVEKNYLNTYFKHNYKLLALPVAISVIYASAVFVSESLGIVYAASLVFMVVLHILGTRALKARTKLGREVEDRIIGLKSYLTAVENPRYASNINFETPDTLKIYEKYLPYAIALDVEPVWTSRFKEQIEQAQSSNQDNLGSFNGLGFYSGQALAGSLGNALTGAISSASVRPGSGSGFSSGGGGGSSGGGGGGGGGGGW